MALTVVTQSNEHDAIAELRKRIMVKASSMYDQLYHVALVKLMDPDLAEKVVRWGLIKLRYKENLEKIQFILGPWLEMYIDNLCLIELKTLRLKTSGNQFTRKGIHKMPGRQLKPLRIVYLAKEEVSKSEHDPMPVAWM